MFDFQRLLNTLILLMVMMTGMLILFFTIYPSSSFLPFIEIPGLPSQEVQQSQIDELVAELETIKADLEDLKNQRSSNISSTQVITATQSLDAAALNSIAEFNDNIGDITTNMDDVSDRLNAMEKVVLDNPGKALEMTVFQNDLENLQGDIEVMRQESARVFNFFQFGIGTIALAMMGLAISNFWLDRRKGEDSEE